MNKGHLGTFSIQKSQQRRSILAPGMSRFILVFVVVLSFCWGSGDSFATSLIERGKAKDSFPGWPRLHLDLTTVAGSLQGWRLRVYYWATRNGGRFDIYTDGKRLLRYSTRRSVPGPKSIRVRLPKNTKHVWIEPVDSKLRLFGMTLESKRGVVVDRMGVSGAELQHWLRVHPKILRSQLRQRSPDLWIMMFGTNEAYNRKLKASEYQKQISKVIGRFKRAVPKASCLLLSPLDTGGPRWRRHYRARRKLNWIRKVQHKAANKYGCAYLDLGTFMGGRSGAWRWSKMKPKLAAWDTIHLTRKGYTRLARTLDALLMKAAGLPAYMRNNNPIVIPRWSGIKLRHPKRLKTFVNKVRMLAANRFRNKIARIMLVGDSHTSSSFIDYLFRRLWQARLGNGGPGWIQPSSMETAVTNIGDVRLFWTGSWHFHSVLRPSSSPKTEKLLGIGGRSFFIEQTNGLHKFQRHKLLTPGIYGVSDFLLPKGKKPLLLDSTGARIVRMKSWNKTDKIWSFPKWTFPTKLWEEDGQVWIGCKSYSKGKCRTRIRWNRLQSVKKSKDAPVKTVYSPSKAWYVKFASDKTDITVYRPSGESRKLRWLRRGGTLRPYRGRWRNTKSLYIGRPVIDAKFVGDRLWLLSSKKPHLSYIKLSDWKMETVIRWIMRKPFKLAHFNKHLVVTQRSGYFLWWYNLKKKQGRAPARMFVRGNKMYLSSDKKNLYIFGNNRHVQVLGEKSWEPEAILSMPGRTTELKKGLRSNMLWARTAQPDALWRLRVYSR